MNSKTALIIIDMQNDFVREGAAMGVAGAGDIIAPIQSLRDAFGKRRLPVVYSRYIADGSLLAKDDEIAWISTLRSPTLACTPGHRRHFGDLGEAAVEEVIDELTPHDDDMVVDKIFYSAFSGTTLHDDLQALGVTHLVMTGVATDVCVDDTARYAVHLGYVVTLVSDGAASGEAGAHDWVMSNFDRHYGSVRTHQEIINDMESID